MSAINADSAPATSAGTFPFMLTPTGVPHLRTDLPMLTSTLHALE